MMRARGRYVAAIAVLVSAIGVAADASARPPSPPPELIEHDAGRGAVGRWGPGSWCWFADPRAVRVAAPRDMTFVGWIDWGGNVTVASYDATTGAHEIRVLATLFHDDHSNPSILVGPDRRLTVFWSAHNGTSLYYRTSLEPESISAWTHVHRVPVYVRGGLGFTYPNPVLLRAEHDRLYLFWRGATWAADDATRTRSGRWGSAGELVESPGQRPYVKIDSNGTDTIAIAFTNGHPRNTRTSIYYMQYRRGWLHHADGRRIARMDGRPVPPHAADIVYDARRTGISAWVWDVALDPTGHPVIVYATFPSPSDHLYWYARWTGRAWVSHFLTRGGPTISPGTIEYEYSGGLALDHAKPSIVYLARKVHGWFEIERWRTVDGGSRWRHSTVVRTPGADNIRPVVTRGSNGGPMSLLWLSGHYGSYTSYQTFIDYLR